MPKKKIIFGKCRICGKEGKLSLEHVPPQKAFNNETVIEYALESWAGKQLIKGKQHQGGIGDYTLCVQCNSDTGSWYGSEYVRWTIIAFDILKILDNNPKFIADKNTINITIKNVYPLRFLKQVITCLFSVVDVNSESDFAETNPDLVKFILDRYRTDLPENYQVFLKLYRKPSKLRRFPLAGKLTLNYYKGKNNNIVPNTMRTQSVSIFSEMAHPPFALVMTNGTSFPGATAISYFHNFSYDDCVDLVLPLTIGAGFTPYPGSY